jgi:hypothetical protein
MVCQHQVNMNRGASNARISYTRLSKCIDLDTECYTRTLMYVQSPKQIALLTHHIFVLVVLLCSTTHYKYYLLTHLLIYLLTAWSRVLLEKQNGL